MNISYTNLGTYKDKDTGEIKPCLPRNDTKLQVVDFKTVWMNQKNLNPVSPKGTDGMIFPFSFNILYSLDKMKEDGMLSNGMVFVDIDCGAGVNDTIMQKMEAINARLGWRIITACTTRKGLHVIFLSDPVTPFVYSMETFKCLSVFAYCVNKICNIDLRTIDKALDTCTFSMKQRLFLRYSDNIYWEDNAIAAGVTDEAMVVLKSEYPELWKKVDNSGDKFNLPDGMRVSNHAQLFGMVEVGTHEYIEHVVRWRLFDSLCCIFVNGQDDVNELWKQWDRCCELIEPVNHSVEWFKQEPRKNKWLKHWSEQKCQTYDEDLLESFGYYVGKKHSNRWFEESAPEDIDDLLK